MADHSPHPEARPPKLDPAQVPAAFRHLISLAERYGVTDDGYRSEMVASLPDSGRTELAQFLTDYDDALDSWLAGPESDGPTFSEAYIVYNSTLLSFPSSDYVLCSTITLLFNY